MDDDVPAPMKPGEKKVLEYSQKARHRISCGLSWDPKMTKTRLGEKLKGMKGHNVDTHDMDLMCLLFDANKDFMDGITGQPDEMMDASHKVYHSGDDTAGIGDLDDELIYVEFLDLPEYFHHIVFIAEIQSAHTFADIDEPRIRLEDTFTHKDIHSVILDAPAGREKTMFVYAHLYRNPAHGWVFQYIGDYLKGSEVPDIIAKAQTYLG